MKNAIKSLCLSILVSCCTCAYADTQSLLDEVKKSGVVNVGMSCEVAPFSYRDADKNIVGFDVDIARAVVKKLEAYTVSPVKMKIVQVTDETRISWVKSGQVDMSVSCINDTRKRQEQIDFSVPYFWDGKGIMYDLKNGPKDIADFAGKTIGFKRASSSEGEIQRFFEEKGLNKPVLKAYDNHTAGIKALVDGQIDGFTDDNSIIINTAMLMEIKVGPGKSLDVTKTPYSPAHFGIGLRENDSKWRKVINYCLHDLWLSGEYQAIYKKWFGPNSNCPIPLGSNGMEPYVKG